MNEYRRNWHEHVPRIDSNRISKIMYKFQPKGRWNIAHSQKTGMTSSCTACWRLLYRPSGLNWAVYYDDEKQVSKFGTGCYYINEKLQFTYIVLQIFKKLNNWNNTTRFWNYVHLIQGLYIIWITIRTGLLSTSNCRPNGGT